MSEYIPFDLQEKIIQNLPVKSLIQFRSVSKAWKSLIDSSDFITAHGVRQTQHHRLLIRYENLTERRIKYVSLVDDDENFPQLRFVPSLPFHVDLLNFRRVIGNSRGLLCFYGDYLVPVGDGNNRAVVWNPSIKKSIAIDLPDELFGVCYKTIFGFGVSPVTCDPKIVVISYFHKWSPVLDKPLKVALYTLSSGQWRSLSSNQLPRSSVQVTLDQVAIDRFIYWLACDKKIAFDGGFTSYYLFLSFDLITEELSKVILPDTLARQLKKNTKLTIYKLRESLGLLEYKDSRNNEQQAYVVWKMDDGVRKSFTKLFTIKAPDVLINRVLGFRNNGEPIMETKHDDTESVALMVYEPNSEHYTDVGINGTYGSFIVFSYMETLLLLDH